MKTLYNLGARLGFFSSKQSQHLDPSLPHCIPLDSSTIMLDETVILRVSGLFCRFYSIFDGKSCLIANKVGPDQMPHHAIYFI